MSDIPTMSQFAKREDCLLAREKWYQERIEALEAELRQQLASSEPVAYRHLHDDGWEYYDAPTGSDCSSCKALFTTPQQPQSVADALEEAAKICDDLEYKNNRFDCAGCGDAIRTLIKRNAKEGE